MQVEIYHNPRCRKSREALAYLEQKGQSPSVRLYLENPLTFDELKTLIQKLNIKPLALIRKNEADYKDNFKGIELSDTKWIEAMVKYPKLIERPIVVYGAKAVVARPASLIDNLF